MPTVCIIGAGYAGIHAAHTARAAGADVVIVEPTGQHDLAPRLAAVAAGRRPAGDAWAPVTALVDADVVRARATLVEEDGPVVHARVVENDREDEDHEGGDQVNGQTHGQR